MIKRYIKYLKRSPKHIQDNHLFIIAGILTMFVAFLWLHFYYGYFKFEFYKDITISESDIRSAKEKEVSASSGSADIMTEMESPIDQVINIFAETKSRFSDIDFPTFGR